MRRAALGRKRKQSDPGFYAEHMPRKPCRGDGDVRKLVHRRVGNHAAIGHEQNAILTDARVLDLHHHAARRGFDVRCRLDDLEQWPQQAARDVRCAGDHAVRLVHRQHHCAKIIRLQHRFARFRGTQTFFTAQRMKPFGEIFQLFARSGIDDADAFQRDVQITGDLFDLGRIAELPWVRRAEVPETAAPPARCAAPRLRGKPRAWDDAVIFR